MLHQKNEGERPSFDRLKMLIMINHGSRGQLMAEIGFLTALDAVTLIAPWYLA
jgi:hypothetical protein